jgi:hypothetical protein
LFTLWTPFARTEKTSLQLVFLPCRRCWPWDPNAPAAFLESLARDRAPLRQRDMPSDCSSIPAAASAFCARLRIAVAARWKAAAACSFALGSSPIFVGVSVSGPVVSGAVGGDRWPASIGIRSSRPLNELGRSELSPMPKNKPTAGPMRTQPIDRSSIIATPVLPMMPSAGKVTKAPQSKQKPTRTDGVRVAKAKITRRNSLRKQRDALKG